MVAGVNGGRVEIKRLKISAGERQIRGRGGGGSSGPEGPIPGGVKLFFKRSFPLGPRLTDGKICLYTPMGHLWSQWQIRESLASPAVSSPLGGGGGAKLVSGVPAAAPAAWRKKRRDGRARPRRLSRRLLALPEFRSLNQSHRWSAGVNCWRGRW